MIFLEILKIMSLEKILVTVIIPTKDRKLLLVDCLKSVINQNYKNLQIIIHDNNSTDGTHEHIKEILKDPRIEYYKSNISLSMTDNWKAAAAYIRGDFFVRFDDDNIMFSNFIYEGIKKIKELKIDVLLCSAIYLAKKKKAFTFFETKDDLIKLNKFQIVYLEFNTLSDSNFILYKTKLIKKILSKRKETFYTTTLPDRYMNYLISDEMSSRNINFYFYNKIFGLVRLDHKKINNFLNFSLYRNMKNFKKFGKFEYCQTQFSLHIFLTINYFLKKCKDLEIKKFIKDKVFSIDSYLIYLVRGHFFHSSTPKNFRQFLHYNMQLLYYAFLFFFNPIAKNNIKDNWNHFHYLIFLVRKNKNFIKNLFKKTKIELKDNYWSTKIRKIRNLKDFSYPLFVKFKNINIYKM